MPHESAEVPDDAPLRSSASRWRTALFVAVLLIGGGLVAVEVIEGSREVSGQSDRSLNSLSPDLCSALDSVSDNPARAADIFRTDIHGPLHELADRVTEIDPVVAGGLLEAKYALEASTGQQPPNERFAPALDNLNRQVLIALRSIGLQPAPCQSEVAEG